MEQRTGVPRSSDTADDAALIEFRKQLEAHRPPMWQAQLEFIAYAGLFVLAFVIPICVGTWRGVCFAYEWIAARIKRA